jgi:Rad3-related DNA helicase
MSYLLDGASADFPRWQDYFEYSIVGAGKPNFFMGSNPFFEVVENGLLKPHYGPLTVRSVYHGGNARLFEKLTQQTGDEILYIGDHIYGDIMRSKELFNWRTLLVVEELEDEFNNLERTRPELDRILTLIQQEENLLDEYHQISAEISTINRRLRLMKKKNGTRETLTQRLTKLNQELSEKENNIKDISQSISSAIEQREEKFHPIWGELMYASLKKSRFAKQIEAYACLYTTKITNFLLYSPNQKFRSVRDIMPHDL